jgi:alpha-tubulin suppressor-like RCC1 family protein
MRTTLRNQHPGRGLFRAGLALLAALACGGAASASEGELSAGGFHTCATTNNGPVYCWGWGQSGQLGDGGVTYQAAFPVAVPETTGLVALEAGGEHTCGRNAAGRVRCWGYDRWGQIGNGPSGSIGAVEAIGITTAVQVATGDQHSCALLQGGAIKCWGHGYHGQLGTGVFQESDVPVDVTVVTDALSIAAGSYHTCAIVGTGQVKCWGRNDYGQLGTTAVPDPGVVTAVTVPGIDGAIALAAGYRHTCALKFDGSVSCWGHGGYGQLGNGGTGDTPTPVSANVAGALEISSGDQHVCVRHDGGTMSCWGYNNDGELADGDAPNQSPDPVPTLGIDSATQIALGSVHSCAIVHADPVNIRCWGRGNFGQLGDGNVGGNHNVVSPVYVRGAAFEGIFGGEGGAFEGP